MRIGVILAIVGCGGSTPPINPTPDIKTGDRIPIPTDMACHDCSDIGTWMSSIEKTASGQLVAVHLGAVIVVDPTTLKTTTWPLPSCP
jgi:hypothetical protein